MFPILPALFAANYSRPPRLSKQWAEGAVTLVDYAVLKNNALADLVDETAKLIPEVTMFGMSPIEGTSYEQSVLVELPKTKFRNPNEGQTLGKSVYALRRFDCRVLNPRWQCDRAIADALPGGPEPAIQREAMHIVEGAWQTLATQFWYGPQGTGDAKGPAGLVQMYNADKYTVDATGTTGGEKTSVWGIRNVGDRIDWLIGNNGSMGVSPVRVGDARDANGDVFEAYIQSMLAHIGLRMSDKRVAGRIKNLTNQDGKGWTDSLTAKLIKKLPAQMRPTHLFANPDAIEQLRLSRVTSVNPNPPVPTESNGIPIVPTEAIVSGETV